MVTPSLPQRGRQPKGASPLDPFFDWIFSLNHQSTINGHAPRGEPQAGQRAPVAPSHSTRFLFRFSTGQNTQNEKGEWEEYASFCSKRHSAMRQTRTENRASKLSCSGLHPQGFVVSSFPVFHGSAGYSHGCPCFSPSSSTALIAKNRPCRFCTIAVTLATRTWVRLRAR